MEERDQAQIEDDPVYVEEEEDEGENLKKERNEYSIGNEANNPPRRGEPGWQPAFRRNRAQGDMEIENGL